MLYQHQLVVVWYPSIADITFKLLPTQASKGVKVAALSCNALDEHTHWLDDVVAHCANKVAIEFPMIADPTREIAVKYGMIDPELKDKAGLPLTCRAVFIIGPDKKLKLTLNYPASGESLYFSACSPCLDHCCLVHQ